MEESTVIQKFLDYLKFEKRFSEHTAKCYGADLRQFSEFLISTSDRSLPADEPISLAQQQAGPATAVATQAALKVDQLLLSTQTDTVRAFLAFLTPLFPRPAISLLPYSF